MESKRRRPAGCLDAEKKLFPQMEDVGTSLFRVNIGEEKGGRGEKNTDRAHLWWSCWFVKGGEEN